LLLNFRPLEKLPIILSSFFCRADVVQKFPLLLIVHSVPQLLCQNAPLDNQLKRGQVKAIRNKIGPPVQFLVKGAA